MPGAAGNPPWHAVRLSEQRPWRSNRAGSGHKREGVVGAAGPLNILYGLRCAEGKARGLGVLQHGGGVVSCAGVQRPSKARSARGHYIIHKGGRAACWHLLPPMVWQGSGEGAQGGGRPHDRVGVPAAENAGSRNQLSLQAVSAAKCASGERCVPAVCRTWGEHRHVAH